MKLSDRYRLMRENGLTTQFLAKKYGVHVRSVRRAIAGTVTRPHWVEEMKKFVARRIEGMTYDQFWNVELEPEKEVEG